jgi:predicted RNase H-like HicB family nuclease
MTYRVLLRKEPTNGYVATALDWPHCQVAAPTRQAALEQIQAAITDLLTTSEIVDLEIPIPVIPSPYTETFGMFRDDPTFAAFLEEVNHYRQERNQIPVD